MKRNLQDKDNHSTIYLVIVYLYLWHTILPWREENPLIQILVFQNSQSRNPRRSECAPGRLDPEILRR